MTSRFLTLIAVFSIVLGPLPVIATDTALPLPPQVPNEQPPVTEVLVRMKDRNEAVRVAVPKHQTAEETVRELSAEENVLYVEPNHMMRALGVPNDPHFAQQWNFGTSTAGVHAQGAWNYTRGEGVIVAVVDSGVAYREYTDQDGVHFARAPDFAPDAFVAGYDFVNDDDLPLDDYGHGTHVAGTIAQETDNGIGAAGIAPKAKIMPIKVIDKTGWGSYADIADGIRFAADHGAHVINVSLGGQEPSRYLAEAIYYAYRKGCVVIAAAGNEGVYGLNYPAAYTSYVIVVGATRVDGTRPAYSNYSRYLDVVAPGGDIEVDQNNDGVVDGIVQQTFSPYDPATFDLYAYEGTSMSTAHVSGIAALILSHQGVETTSFIHVRQALRASATDLGVRGRDQEYGYGIVNAEKAIWYGMKKPVQEGGAAIPAEQSGTYSLTMVPSMKTHETQVASWTTPSPRITKRSWIGVYTQGAPSNRPLTWRRIPNTATSGTYPVTLKHPGMYEIRLFEGATYNQVRVATFMVTSAGVYVDGYSVSASTQARLHTPYITTWNTPERHPMKSWIGIYTKGASSKEPLHWERITNTARTGTYSFTPEAPGDYEVRLFKGATYTIVGTHTFSVDE